MKSMIGRLQIGALLLCMTSGAAAATLAQQCASLAGSLNITNAVGTHSELVTAGTVLQFPNVDSSCTRPSQRVSADICRVYMNVTTSNTSGIYMETWLPTNWTGRFLSTGNGGLGGCIQYEDIDYATNLGFAAVGTNNGHNGMTGVSFLHNPGTIEDFAFRAVHTGVVVGKQISEAFYQRPHNRSYYLGCSTGGREGFKEAQAFPGDFDGIVAGAPAFSFNNLTSWSSNFLIITGSPQSATFVPMNMWSVIHQDILDQCDDLDGASDGILEFPDRCPYNPSGLVCAAGNTTNCLTPTQVETVRKIFSPLINTDGSLVYPRMQPGAELVGAPQTYFTGQPFGASDWFRYAIFNDPSWNQSTLTPQDWTLSSHLNLFNIETWDDLTAFHQTGGKILHYHGQQDSTISSENSPRYYEHISQTMNMSPSELDEFYRLFRISGMSHCTGGEGAHYIGNQVNNVASYDPDHNVLMAMVRWVEQGVAPETITGTGYAGGSGGYPGPGSNATAYTRRHCRWPYRNMFSGNGSVQDPDSWNCV